MSTATPRSYRSSRTISSSSIRALSSGKSTSDAAAAWSVVATRRSRSTPVKSHSSTNVTAGISRCVRSTCSTIARRIPRTGTRRPSVGAAAAAHVGLGDAAAGPGALHRRDVDRSSRASRCSGRASSGSEPTTATMGSAGAGCLERRRAPPSAAAARRRRRSAQAWRRRRRARPPARGCGVRRRPPASRSRPSPCRSESRRSARSPRPSSPSRTSQRAISPSVRPSPRSGSVNACAMVARVVGDCADGHDACPHRDRSDAEAPDGKPSL